MTKLFHRNRYWPNGSYFQSDDVANYSISCVHSDGVNGGGWIYPDGRSCNSSTTPVQCTNVLTSGFVFVQLQRVASFNKMELAYKCCLPNHCSNEHTDSVIANIYGMLYSYVTTLSQFYRRHIYH